MSAELLKTICYLLSGGFLIFLAITVTRDNFANRLNRATGAMLFFGGMGPIFMALGIMVAQSTAGRSGLDESTAYNLRHLWELFFPCLLIFSWLFPTDRLKGFRHHRVRYAIFLPQAMHVILVLFFTQIVQTLDIFKVETGGRGFASLVLDPLSRLVSWSTLFVGVVRAYEMVIFGAVNLIYVFVAIYFLESGKKYVTNPRVRTQTKWVLWGTRIGLGLFAVTQLGAMVFPEQFSQETQSTLLIMAVLSGASLFVFATIRHQFLDVQMVFRQSFVNTVTSAILVGIYVLLVVQSRNILASMFDVQAELVSYGFIVLLLLFFQPINNWLDNLVRSMFLRTRTDHRHVIEQFSRQVIPITDPAQLRQTIEETLKTTLLVDRVYFILFDDTVNEYTVLPSDDYPKRIVVDREDLMLRGVNLLESPTYYYSLSDYRQDSDLAEILEGRTVRMVLPMKDANHMLGFVALTGKAAGYRYSSEDLNLLGVLSNQMVSALTNARLYVESLERLRLQEEINMARQIQLDLLPSEPPQTPCSTISAESTPSRTIGGDYYDFIVKDDNRLGIVIADASGKGMPAALMIAQTQAIIRSEVNNGSPIAAMLKNVNQQIAETTSSEKYVTLFYAELDTADGTLRFANAGHNYPILVRSDGSVELLKTGGPVLGAFPLMEYESSAIQLKPNDLLFLFTDGLSEAMDTDEREYGEDRLLRLVSQHRQSDTRSIIETVLSDVRL